MPELESDSMMERLEEKYQDDNRYYKTNYGVIFPESDKSKMEVTIMDRLDIGGGEFLNPHHQVRKEGNFTNEQQMVLADAVYGLLLGNERIDIDKWLGGKNVNKKLQTVDHEIM